MQSAADKRIGELLRRTEKLLAEIEDALDFFRAAGIAIEVEEEIQSASLTTRESDRLTAPGRVV